MTWIKICGITNLEDGLKAASLGVDALGFVFAASSRRIAPDAAKKIIQALPPTLLNVGVFVNEEWSEVQRLADYCRLSVLQFHGEESPEYCQKFLHPVVKAIRIRDSESLKDLERYHGPSILLDTYSPGNAGGTGKSFPWEVAVIAKEKRDFILSGGLGPLNVGEAIKKVKPWGVDASTGVESSPGKKDFLKMEKFIKEVRKADETTG